MSATPQRGAAILIRSGSARAWGVAVRPRTLLVAISPVLVGAALGFERAGTIDPLAALLVPVMSLWARAPALLLPILVAPLAVRLLRDFAHCPRGVVCNEVLFRTFRLELWFAVLLSAGALLAGKPA
jgi:1,4-dihydroxy-2-naphthoate octaprenyltransferase